MQENKYILLNKVDSWQLKIEIKQQKMEMEQNKIRLELQKGVWCGYQDIWDTSKAKITYDKILHSSTNMEDPGIGLNTQSGIITICFVYIMSSYFASRSVHSARDRCVESFIQPPVWSGHQPV